MVKFRQCSSLELKRLNYTRNLTGKIVWGSQLNIIYGNNGHGKTSWLEAIHVLARTNPFELNAYKEAIRFGERTATYMWTSISGA